MSNQEWQELRVVHMNTEYSDVARQSHEKQFSIQGVVECSWSESALESLLAFFLRFLRTSLARTGT